MGIFLNFTPAYKLKLETLNHCFLTFTIILSAVSQPPSPFLYLIHPPPLLISSPSLHSVHRLSLLLLPFFLLYFLETSNWVCVLKLNSMPKNTSSSKKPAKTQETLVVGDAKPSLKPKKSSNEIDEIFSSKKRKNPEGKKKTHHNKSNKDDTVTVEQQPKLKNKKSKRATDGDFSDDRPPARPRKRSEDGLAVYTEEELGINKADAGNTPLCPFDCSCCF
ncbi:hypothetical protein Dsin_000148 [Dipteronia sinensis]|uniref:DUF1764 domain-containing protein n=1 Tax=Dipteronia sinensis TaxID=43782 RepID=A0AAD9ZJK4_9ROSI|nr:hypothetical protein Dsin_000148 [Dipteronia sinensis]